LSEKKWRFLPLSVNDAYTNMAIDEAILRSLAEDNSIPNTVRLYRWNPSAVSIGYFQNLHLEVDLDKAKKMHVNVVRRLTGGGAVYHDYHGEITYSVIARLEGSGIPKGILDSYRYICNGLIIALKNMGINAEFRPYNDILVNGKKISGSAQTRKVGIILQHGTLLVDVNVDKMFSLLKVPNEKIRDKLIASVKERVTSLKHVLGNKPSFDYVAEALKKGFSDALKVEFFHGELFDIEKEKLPSLIEKYKDYQWLNLR